LQRGVPARASWVRCSVGGASGVPLQTVETEFALAPLVEVAKGLAVGVVREHSQRDLKEAAPARVRMEAMKSVPSREVNRLG